MKGGTRYVKKTKKDLKNLKKGKRYSIIPKISIFVLILIILLFTIKFIFLTNIFFMSSDINSINAKTHILQKENDYLYEEINKNSALTNIYIKARGMGFQEGVFLYL
jgi:cell division protein FtsL